MKDDFLRQVYPLVAYGFPVIAPDLAGYANYGAEGNPPSGYAQADDVARSTLDGARAMRNLAPARLSDQVVIVGHSQGGHTALSALAAAETYGAGITVAAVAIFAPLWLSQRSWGAIFLLADSFPIADSPAANVVTLWYHYTHGELLDGPGGGLLPFAEDKRDAIQAFVDGTCWSDSYPALEALGTTVKDLFDPAFMAAVQGTAAVNNPCPAAEPGKTVCETWKARYLGDRPHLTGAAAEVPLLVVYGGKDTTIPPDRFQCALDRLDADGANMTQCFDPEGAHGDTVARQADYVVQWIAFHTLGTPLETSCPSDAIVLLDPEGAPVPCAPVPPND